MKHENASGLSEAPNCFKPSSNRFYPRTLTKPAAILAICLLAFSSGYSQLRDCPDCVVPSFQAFTIYYTLQPGSTFGLGFEAGNWNKDASRFSYFLGSKIQWFQFNPNSEKFSNVAENIRFSLYVKGQARLVDRLYFELSPEFVNLSTFDLGLGLRYTYPLSESLGIGIEPTYSIVQKEYSLNANVHFAL